MRRAVEPTGSQGRVDRASPAGSIGQHPGEPGEPAGVRSWRRTLWVVAASQAVTLIGFALVTPFLPLYIQELGVRDRSEVLLWSGILAGASAVPLAFMTPVWGSLADRFGRKTMLVRALVGGSVALVGIAFVADVGQLLVLRIFQGLLSGSQGAALALVAAAAPTRQVGFAVGLVGGAVQTGNSVGPALGGLAVELIGFRGTFLVGAALLAASMVIVLLWAEEPPSALRTAPAGRAAGDPGSWLATMLRPFAWPGFRLVLAVQVVAQAGNGAGIALLPIYLQDLSRPDWMSPQVGSGLAVTLTAAAAAVTMPLFGGWSDRHGAWGLLSGSLLVMALALVGQALVGTVAPFLLLRVGSGVALGGMMATLGALTKHQAPVGREGAAYGAAAAAQAIGWGLGPIVGSGVATVAGVPAAFLVLGAAAAAFVLPAARRR